MSYRIFTENATNDGDTCPEILQSSMSNETFKLLVEILSKTCMQ